ncbi:hypothetical protein EW146_g4147 [Bondarzewia mesenterica]|uniref:Major facilitator superfamily (MFS) profile domain-containing protein n=1 Tax=Bondarzewia mesenterica TaxID=1095465 RepID=A0A4S4LX82_9AGAM|nr:hypothetical protein EW146_g4147 [Bondarzewia mesenterica]
MFSNEKGGTRAVTNKAGVPSYLGLSGDRLIFAITVTATCGFGLFGYDQGVMSGIISAPQFFRVFPDLDPANNPSGSATMQAFYTAIYEVGCLAGAFFALLYGNKLGRRRNMYIGGFFVLIGSIIQITPMPGHRAGHQFVIGRIVTGFGNGLNTATIPSWQAECSKSHNRGLHICIETSMIAIGTVIAYWIDFGLSFVDSSLSWRLPIGLQMIFVALLYTGITFLPESPRWLLSTGHEEEGERVVAALANMPIDSEETQLDKRIILESIASMKGELHPRDVLTSGRRNICVGCSWDAQASFSSRLAGATRSSTLREPVIFQQYIGLNRRLSLILGGVNVTVYACAALLSYPMIERVGRRPMFFWGSVGQGLSMLLSSLCLIKYNVFHDHQDKVLWGAVVGLFLFLISFGCTWLGLPWLYPAEINPLRIRTNANAMSTMTNWSWNFAVVMWTPPMLASLGGFGTFLFFAIVNFCFCPIIYAFYPETKGRSLEELDVVFGKAYAENAWYVRVADEMPRLSKAEIETEAHKYGLGDMEKANAPPVVDSERWSRDDDRKKMME